MNLEYRHRLKKACDDMKQAVDNMKKSFDGFNLAIIFLSISLLSQQALVFLNIFGVK